MFSEFRRILRILLREPGFSLPCVGSLALAIGIATTVFSAVNSILLRPLDLPKPDRLALLWGVERSGDTRSVVSFADFEDWRKNTPAFESAAAYTSYYKPVLTRNGPPERLSSLRISHGYFNVFEAKPFIGRFFRPEEDFDGQDDVVVLSYALWRQRFQSNTSIIGQKILLDGRPETVVGVAGPDLKSLPVSLGGVRPQVYRPVGEERGEKSRDGRHLQTIVRLKPGATIAQAQAELNVLCHRMERLHPDSDAHLAVRIVSIKDDLTRNLRPGLVGLQLSILAVVFIACGNIANLLLARSTRRKREWAVRSALGASMRHLAGLLLLESLVLSCAGGAIGFMLALWGRTALQLAAAKFLPDTHSFPFDWHVLAFSALLSIGVGLVFGMAPLSQLVLSPVGERKGRGCAPPDSNGTRQVFGRCAQLRDRFARVSPELLKDGGRSVAGNRKQMLRPVLAAAQIAIALVLLISAGLLTRSFLRLRAVNPGFDPRGVLTAGITLPPARYKTDASRVEFFARLLANLRALPGVNRSALVTTLPLSGDFDTVAIQIEGRPVTPGERSFPDRYIVTPDYFAAVKIPLLEGRLFDERDDASHKYVAIISRTAARVLFPGESPIGKKIRAGAASGDWDHSPYREIVGVVGDVEQYALGMPARPQLYMPHAQFADGYVTLILRTTRDPALLTEPLRRAVLAADPEQPIYDVIPLEDLVAGSIAMRRFSIWILGGFAISALALAMMGVYGVISYGVATRRQEFAVRMAVGASPADVCKEAVAAAVPMILIGTFIGLGAAFAARKLLDKFLFGVSSADLASFLGVPLAMLLVAFAASYVPARRAAHIQPSEALKYE